MQEKTIEEINDVYELELKKILRVINKEKAKRVLLQFPEGLKPYSQVIADFIERESKAQCLIWMGSCFGACDIPIETEKLGVDLIIHFGHSDWGYKDKGIKSV